MSGLRSSERNVKFKSKLSIYNGLDVYSNALPLSLLDTASLSSSSPSRATTPLSTVAQSPLSGARCCTCNVVFEDFREQRDHFRLDWHRFNVLNAVRKRPALSLEQFEALVVNNEEKDDDHDKGSSNDELDQASPEDSSDDEDDDGDWNFMNSPMVYFYNDKLVFSVLKHLLPPNFDSESSKEFRLSKSILPERLAILMVGGGHFAGAVFNAEGQVEVHKTFHSYTVRAKQGGSQSTSDNVNGMAKSAGANLRRYNEASLEKHVNDIVAKWEPLLLQCQLIFYRAGNPRLRRILFPGYSNNNNNNNNAKNSLWTKIQSRCRTIPFATRRANFKEVQRVFELITSIEVHGELHEFEEQRREQRQRQVKTETERRRRIRRSKSREPKVRPSPIADMGLNDDDGDNNDHDDDDSVELTWSTQSVSTRELSEFEVDFGRREIEKSPSVEKSLLSSTLKNDLITACKSGDLRLLRRVLDALDTNNEDEEGKDDDTLATRLSKLRLGNKPELSALHLASISGSVGIVKALLTAGADPSVKDGLKRLPYHVSANRETRQTFMAFRMENEGTFDFDLAQIPLGLNEEQERQRRERQRAKKKDKRRVKQEEKKLEEERRKIEREKEDEKRRFEALSEREKRALAAERRLKAQGEHCNVSTENCCNQCHADLRGRVPFTYDQFNFCSLKCLQIHRKRIK